jgi:hypothetical protein
MTIRGGEEFDWSTLVPQVVHPLKVAIMEALLWVDQPLSATDLTKLFDSDRYGVAHVSYHLVKLADIEALQVVGERAARGTTERFYFWPGVNGQPERGSG